MKIVIKKPSISLPKIKNTNQSLKTTDFIKYLYDFDAFSKKYLPPTITKFILFVLISSVITFTTYFLTSYIRADGLSTMEIAKQVAFLNYAMWGAFMMFVLGINLLMVLLFRILKIVQNDKEFLLNQLTVAVGGYLFMRLVALVIILADEKLPFEVNFEYSFFNFNLLTILFITQIILALVIYNFLLGNLPDRVRKNPLLTMLLTVIYIASVWTLTAP